jgi:hypothetical protein
MVAVADAVADADDEADADADMDGAVEEEKDGYADDVGVIVTGGFGRNEVEDEEEGVGDTVDEGTALDVIVKEAEGEIVAEADELLDEDAVLLVVPLAVGVAVALPTTQNEFKVLSSS